LSVKTKTTKLTTAAVQAAAVNYLEQMKKLRKQKLFHSFVQARLIEMCQQWFPYLHPIKEIQGLAGGRNDLILFEFDGRKVLIEIFGTASQVSRDLRILDNTKADVKIAVIIDKEIDPQVFEHFLRENPESNYPFIFASEVVDPSRAHEGRLKLHELITRDEVRRLSRVIEKLSTNAFHRFLSECRRDALLVYTEDDIRQGTITFHKVFVTLVIRRLSELGIALPALKKLAKWISKPGAVDFVVQNMTLGLNMFLYTDLRENFGFYSDIDLLDFLRIGSEIAEAHVLMSMNSVFFEVLDKYYTKKVLDVPRRPQVFAGHSQVVETPSGRLVTFSVPLRTDKIVVYPPWAGADKKGMTEREIVRAIEVAGPNGSVRCRVASGTTSTQQPRARTAKGAGN
jgi:hypothetical protein